MSPRFAPALRALALALPLVLVAALGSAHAETDPQSNELSANVDIAPSNDGIYALFGAQYTRFFPGLDRQDEVVPILRRFVRHPSAVWARFERLGNSSDSRTSLSLGGELQVLDGRVYGKAEAGLSKEDIGYDEDEGGYVDVPFYVELGGRPLELLSLGAFYRARAILTSTDPGPNIITPAEREGTDQILGGTLMYSTPTDRFFVNVSAGYRFVDWTFAGFHPGDITVRGPQADVLLSVQSSRAVSWQLRVQGAREEWDNQRLGDTGDDYVGDEVEKTVFAGQGEGAFVYWFEGHYAFRLSLGGGYRTAEPIYYLNDPNNRFPNRREDLGFGKVGIGVLGRF